MTTKTKTPSLIRTSQERRQWAATHANEQTIRDVAFYRPQVAKVRRDEGQTFDEIEQLQELLDRRQLDWSDFEQDVEVDRLFSQPEAQIYESDRWQAEAERLGREETKLREKAAKLSDELNALMTQIALAESANRNFGFARGQHTRIRNGNPRLFGPEATAFVGTNCGVTDPTSQQPSRLAGVGGV